jgi:hypothetical protein
MSIRTTCTILIGLALVLVTVGAEAQFKNILLDSSRSKAGRYPVEPSVAISFKNPDMIVAGSAIDNVYQSADGGQTWTSFVISSRYGVWGDPVLVSDYSGNFFYLHLSDPSGKNWESEELLDRIVIQKSKDGGKTWDSGESIGHNPPKDQDKPWATVDRKGNVYVSWTQFDKYGSEDPECKSSVMFSKSSNGTKWSKPFKISQYDGDCRDDDDTPQGAVPAVTNDGKVFIAWSNAGYIWLDRSFNGGENWLSNDIAITEHTGGWNFSIPGLDRTNGMPVLVCDNSTGMFSGALYLVWADQRNGEDDTDIWFSRSFNFGDNWTAPLRINNDDPGSHQFLPTITVDPSNGYIYIIYYDRRDYDDDQTDVYLAYSTDNGGTFKNVKLSESPFKPQADVFFGDYGSVAANQGRIVAMWTRMDNGKTSIWGTVFKHEDVDGAKEAPKTGKKKGKR